MRRIVCMLLVLIMVITGCGTDNKNEKELKSKTTIENKFEKSNENSQDVIKESTGQISFGYLDENTDVYEYDGKDVEIPFYLENQGNENESDAKVGLLLFVDGNVQDYRIEENGKAETMQKITLKPKEKKEFKMIFKPVSGKKGEKVGVIPAVIWNPDSLPEEKKPIWGNNQQLSANIPLEINMKCDGTNQLKSTKKNVESSDIPEEILNEYKNTYVDDVYDALDASVNFTMESSEKDKPVLYGKDGKAPITLKLFGGKNVNEKITVFINNNPVKIDEKDYVEVKTEKGKMLTVTMNLDLSKSDRINSIYAIVMTSGSDYKIQDIYKTDSLLLINEKKHKEALCLLTEGKELILKNLINNEVVNKYQLNKKQCVNSMIKLDEGYCVQIYEASRKLKDQVVQGITVYDTPDESEIVNVSMKFFDKEFNETATVDVSKLAKERKCEDLLMTNFTVSPDGSKIAWDVDESILCYDRETKKFSEYNQITKKDIVAEIIIFAGNDKLAFYGSKGEMEGDTCYGYLNLSDKKIYSFIEKKYEAFSLNADARYIWLNDGESPEDGTASGKMPMIDTMTGKTSIVHLDNIESAKARITEDGKYIIAISQTEEKSFRVRQYDAISGKVLNEKKYDFGGLVHASEIIYMNDEKSYGIIYGTDKGDKLEQFELK